MVPFPDLTAWAHATADVVRENTKRQSSPASFFCSHGQTLCLAAGYFRDDRLSEAARGGVASKHRHKNQLAIYGQLMAAFEYMLKDFVAKVIDATSAFDDKVKAQDWLSVTTDRVLVQRVVQASIGATLVHPTLGWHTPDVVNQRFKAVFNTQPILGTEIRTLNILWIIRHSVAHNAGFVTAHDAARINLPALAERIVKIDEEYIQEAYEFLKVIAQRVASGTGTAVLRQWLQTVKPYGSDFARDQPTYVRLKHLASCVVPRTHELPVVGEPDYNADWAAYNV